MYELSSFAIADQAPENFIQTIYSVAAIIYSHTFFPHVPSYQHFEGIEHYRTQLSYYTAKVLFVEPLWHTTDKMEYNYKNARTDAEITTCH